MATADALATSTAYLKNMGTTNPALQAMYYVPDIQVHVYTAAQCWVLL